MYNHSYILMISKQSMHWLCKWKHISNDELWLKVSPTLNVIFPLMCKTFTVVIIIMIIIQDNTGYCIDYAFQCRCYQSRKSRWLIKLCMISKTHVTWHGEICQKEGTYTTQKVMHPRQTTAEPYTSGGKHMSRHCFHIQSGFDSSDMIKTRTEQHHKYQKRAKVCVEV